MLLDKHYAGTHPSLTQSVDGMLCKAIRGDETGRLSAARHDPRDNGYYRWQELIALEENEFSIPIILDQLEDEMHELTCDSHDDLQSYFGRFSYCQRRLDYTVRRYKELKIKRSRNHPFPNLKRIFLDKIKWLPDKMKWLPGFRRVVQICIDDDDISIKDAFLKILCYGY